MIKLKTGHANLPLHTGRAPFWLFERMKKLSREIVIFIIEEFGTKEVLKKLSDPFWFQSFGCILGFDWHSSGLTTTVCGALKEGIKSLPNDIGIYVAGGKGKVALKTPEEIKEYCDILGISADELIYASRMSAKVDNTAVQDGFQLYHHVIVFDKNQNWAVIQQGMNEKTGFARRYHWLSDKLRSFVEEPHAAVCSDWRGNVLNLVALENKEVRSSIVHLSSEKPERVLKEFESLVELNLPKRHAILLKDIKKESLRKVLLTTYEKSTKDFEELLSIKGIGAKTLRALALLSELIYGVSLSYRDPAKYSFAHGGKDGYPYPVDKETYDSTIEFFEKALNSAKIDRTEKVKAFKRLSGFFSGSKLR